MTAEICELAFIELDENLNEPPYHHHPMHRQLALEARRRGVSLNSLIVATLEKEAHQAA